MTVGIVVLTALAVATSLAWTVGFTPAGAFRAIPTIGTRPRTGSPNTRRPDRPRAGCWWCPVPRSPTRCGGTVTTSRFRFSATFRGGARLDSTYPPQTIRALDSVQRLIAAGRPSAGLADTLERQGIAHLVVRNDLDPQTSRSARPLLVHRAIDGSPGLQKVAEFGDPVVRAPWGFVSDSGLAVPPPSRSTGSGANPATPYLTPASDLAPRQPVGRSHCCASTNAADCSGNRRWGPCCSPPMPSAPDWPFRRGVQGDRDGTLPSTGRPTTAGSTTIPPPSVPGDERNTFNRVPDYPAVGAPLVVGQWSGGRLSASSSSSDATTLPNVAPASGPVAAVDGDPATAWVSNSLQPAIGQWLQIDFDQPVTNAVLTITPSATAVGAQVRRMQISTTNGTTTVTFDQPGKLLTVALPVGETPWVRITAVGTDDGSSGVQFGITDLAVTQYDASGYAHPVELRHTVVVPPAAGRVGGRGLGSGFRTARPRRLRRLPDGVHCAASMAVVRRNR